jgi:hypothetical protein
MSEQIQSQAISRRRVLFLVGLAASLAVPTTVLTSSDVKAQQPNEQGTPAGQAAPKEKVKKKKKKATPSSMAPQPTEPKAQ